MKSKLLMLLAIALLSCNVVFANLEIEGIKVYKNEDRVFDADENGGEIDRVEGQDFIEFRIDLKNNNENSTLEDVLVFGEIQDIDDGDDIEKDLNLFDLREGEEERKVLTFTIPDDVEVDTYTANIIIRAIAENNTEQKFEQEYDIEVRRDDEDRFDIEETLKNITAMCQQVSGLKEEVTISEEHKQELSVCVTERDSAKEQADFAKERYEKLEQEKEMLTSNQGNSTKTILDLNDDLDSCQANLQRRNQELDDLEDQREKDKSNQNMMMIVLVGGAAAAYWWWKNKQTPKVGGMSSNQAKGGFNLGSLNRGE